MTIPLTVPLPLTVTVTELCFLSPACQCHPSDRPPAVAIRSEPILEGLGYGTLHTNPPVHQQEFSASFSPPLTRRSGQPSGAPSLSRYLH
ncbi:hypothetical protein BZA05DRAFT_396869, partial [Tricharina praecox]|uniref:uncharacterized protein n=1 Tax=Tricharina praecox TaxID=43433 RepID=UPI00221E8E5F